MNHELKPDHRRSDADREVLLVDEGFIGFDVDFAREPRVLVTLVPFTPSLACDVIS